MLPNIYGKCTNMYNWQPMTDEDVDWVNDPSKTPQEKEKQKS